jgi:hypothetical protein
VLYQLSYVGGGSPSLAALWWPSRSRYNPRTDGFLLERGLPAGDPRTAADKTANV